LYLVFVVGDSNTTIQYVFDDAKDQIYYVDLCPKILHGSAIRSSISGHSRIRLEKLHVSCAGKPVLSNLDLLSLSLNSTVFHLPARKSPPSDSSAITPEMVEVWKGVAKWDLHRSGSLNWACVLPIAKMPQLSDAEHEWNAWFYTILDDALQCEHLSRYNATAQFIGNGKTPAKNQYKSPLVGTGNV
jgi:hypothetical protein